MQFPQDGRVSEAVSRMVPGRFWAVKGELESTELHRMLVEIVRTA
jgi:hypothetical protein